MSEKEFMAANPDAEFIGFIKVGSRGVPEFYTDREKYNARLDRIWDSGHDFECRIIKE